MKLGGGGFGKNVKAYIQDVVEMSTNKFAGLKIKKPSKKHELMGVDCNLSLK
jgi:hypothetical protein